MIRGFFQLLIGILFLNAAYGQDYDAIYGSPYAGSLGVHNNPASMLMTPFKWDITLFGVQAKSSTNLFTIYNYSLLSNPAKSKYAFDDGNKKRFASLSLNLNLLNGRVAMGRRSAFAFGLNIKNGSNLSTSSYNFLDTLNSTGDFFRINNPSATYSGKLISATWTEIYAGFSHTLIDDDAKRINAGLTLKVNKGLSGASAELFSGQFAQDGNDYNLTGALLNYRYSANYDQWNKANSTGTNLSNFLRYTNGGVSFDAGLEYIVKPNQVRIYGDEDDYYDYDWKIGVSLLDAGFTKYQASNQSRDGGDIRQDVTNLRLDNKFDSTITTAAIFNDSLSTIFNEFTGIGGNFHIINPMRLQINVDRFISRHFYINANLSVNMPSGWTKQYLTVHSMDLLTVTPRWETARFGVYLPIQVTNTNRFWIGGAFKAGPVLLGFHNWANLFAKNTVQNGGGYIALIIRNLGSNSKKYDRRLDCPAL